jgi:hypothetical protein
MPPVPFRRFISGLLALAFVIHTCRAHARLFPRRSPPRLLTAAARGGLRPRLHSDRGGPPDPKARLLHLSYSTASSGSVFYIQPPSTFVFTPIDGIRSRGSAPQRDRFAMVAIVGASGNGSA